MTLTAVPSRIRFSNVPGAGQFATELQAIALSLLQPILGERAIASLTAEEIEAYRTAIAALSDKVKATGFTTEDNAILLVPIVLEERFVLDISCTVLLNNIDHVALAVYLGSPLAGDLAAYLGL